MSTWHYCVVGRPVSGTNSQQIVRVGSRRMVLKSKAQREWRADAVAQLCQQRGVRRPIAGPCAITLHIYRQRNQGDVDNYAKGVLDALQDARILDDDKHVTELHLYRHTDPARPRVEITIALRGTEAA